MSTQGRLGRQLTDSDRILDLLEQLCNENRHVIATLHATFIDNQNRIGLNVQDIRQLADPNNWKYQSLILTRYFPGYALQIQDLFFKIGVYLETVNLKEDPIIIDGNIIHFPKIDRSVSTKSIMYTVSETHIREMFDPIPKQEVLNDYTPFLDVTDNSLDTWNNNTANNINEA